MKIISRAIKKIKSWSKPDMNGRTNKVAMTILGFMIALPFVVDLGIKVGIYSMTAGALDKNASKLMIMVQGLTTSWPDVLAYKTLVESQMFTEITLKSFDFSYIGLMLLIWGFLFATSFVAADRNKNKSYKKDGWMEFGNIDDFNRDMAYPPGAEVPKDPPENSYEPGNMILSEHVRYDLEPKGTNTYSCALIVGATGSGKSFTYVKPNILQMNSSYIVTDPKGELTESLGTTLLNHGYDVRVFNTDEPMYSCMYNPFKYIRNEAGIVTLANVFLENTKESDAGAGDPFFPLAEKNFYLMLFFYIYTVYKDQPEKQNFKTVYELYQMADEQDNYGMKRGEAPPESPMDKIFKQLAKDDPTNPSLNYYAVFKKGSPKTKQSILISAGVKLWFMSVPEIANLMSDDNLHLESVGDRKSALFAIIPTQDDKYRFLSAMLFTQLFELLYHIGNTVNPSSWLLTKGNCVALRSEPFVQGTESAKTTLEDLKKKQALWSKAEIEDDNELMKTDKEIEKKFSTPNEYGIKPWPMARLIVKEQGKRVVLEEFKSRAAAEIVLDAVKNGEIIHGEKSLTCHVRFVLDEFFSVGKINGFDMKIATFRSLRISADIIVQSIAQLKEMYEDREGKITSNCSVTILLGANSMDDCEWFSDLCGQTTVKSESLNMDTTGIMQGVKGGTISDNAQMLIRPEQIRAMKKDECLVIVNTKMPIKDKKYSALNHPRWKETYSPKSKDQVDNEFQFKRIFFIEQKNENLVTTTLHSVYDATDSNENRLQTKKSMSVIAGQVPQGEDIALRTEDGVKTVKKTEMHTEVGVVRDRPRKGDPDVYDKEKAKAEGTNLRQKALSAYTDYLIPPDDRVPLSALSPSLYHMMEKGLESGELEIRDGTVMPVDKKKAYMADLLDDMF